MRNIFVLSFLSFSFFVFSCKQTESKNVENKTEAKVPEKFTVDSVKVDDSVKINEMLSVKYSSKVLVFPSIKNKMLLDSIYYDHKGISDYSKQGLRNFLQNDKNKYFASVKEDSKNWISDVQYPQNWEAGSFMKLISQNDNFLQIEYLYTSYEGGAHGNYSFDTRIFDLKNNKKLHLTDITTMPKEKLEDLLKKNLDKIPSGTTDSNGTVKNSDMLLVDIIPANDDFYFDSNNLYFHYSPYEIAAFAAGDIVIPVSWEELKETINPEFKKRLKIN